MNQHGEALMPCKPKKARLLLREKKAKIVKYEPFTIQLLYGSSGYKQPVEVGVDLGAKTTGIAVVSEDKVLAKGEVELRQDVKQNLTRCRTYRRSRRNRKTRYRPARFDHRKKEKGWLPPSIQSRIDNTFRWIDRFRSLLPESTLHIEVGKFDVQKMIDPEIQGVDYQKGQTYGYYDVRYYVLDRDDYTCQLCKKSGKILNTHHIVYTSHGGSNRADNLITLCTDCHTDHNHQKGEVLWQWMMEGKKTPSYKEGPFMNSFRRRVFDKYPEAHITYGSTTTPHRKKLGLEKTHYNDAIVATGIPAIKSNTDDIFRIVQFRKKKRSLHEATARKGRKEPNRTQRRNAKNTKALKRFYLNDKVRYNGQIGFITGFTGKTMAYIKDIEGNYITKSGKTYKQVNLSDCQLLNHQNNWQFIPH
jgi:hypothetical protein